MSQHSSACSQHPASLQPPHAAELLLIALVRDPAQCETLLGDLFEEFQCIATEQCVEQANRWYWSQLLRSVVPLMGMTFRENAVRGAFRILANAVAGLAAILLMFIVSFWTVTWAYAAGSGGEFVDGVLAFARYPAVVYLWWTVTLATVGLVIGNALARFGGSTGFISSLVVSATGIPFCALTIAAGPSGSVEWSELACCAVLVPALVLGALRFVHKARRNVVTALSLGITMLACGYRPIRAQSVDAKQVAQVRAIANELRAAAPLPGLSIAVSRNGRIIFAEGFGFADIATKRPVTVDTRFRTGSVGKVITATALGRLMQEGRIDVDAPIQTYVPSFPPKPWPITSRELAGHLSGVGHYSDADKIEPRFYSSVTEALTVFAHEDLREQPNTRYRYSTHGFTLLSAAIEGVAKQPFLEYLQQAVFTPLGMRSTAPDMRAEPSPALATYYEVRDGVLSAVEQPEDPSYKWAGGGLTSTPSDLVRMAEGYFNGFLDSATVAVMWKSQRVPGGNETGVGLGWRNGQDAFGRRTFEHAGSMQGTRAVIVIYPKEHLAIAIMTNREWPSTVEETAHMLAVPFLNANRAHPSLKGTYDVTVEMLSGTGDKTAAQGVIKFDGTRGEITFSANAKPPEVIKLFAVDSTNVYALVRADGVYYATFNLDGDVLTGRAIAYGSPQRSSPLTNPSFMSFVRGRAVR